MTFRVSILEIYVFYKKNTCELLKFSNYNLKIFFKTI